MNSQNIGNNGISTIEKCHMNAQPLSMGEQDLSNVSIHFSQISGGYNQDQFSEYYNERQELKKTIISLWLQWKNSANPAIIKLLTNAIFRLSITSAEIYNNIDEYEKQILLLDEAKTIGFCTEFHNEYLDLLNSQNLFAKMCINLTESMQHLSSPQQTDPISKMIMECSSYINGPYHKILKTFSVWKSRQDIKLYQQNYLQNIKNLYNDSELLEKITQYIRNHMFINNEIQDLKTQIVYGLFLNTKDINEQRSWILDQPYNSHLDIYLAHYFDSAHQIFTFFTTPESHKVSALRNCLEKFDKLSENLVVIRDHYKNKQALTNNYTLFQRGFSAINVILQHVQNQPLTDTVTIKILKHVKNIQSSVKQIINDWNKYRYSHRADQLKTQIECLMMDDASTINIKEITNILKASGFVDDFLIHYVFPFFKQTSKQLNKEFMVMVADLDNIILPKTLENSSLHPVYSNPNDSKKI